MSTFHAWHRSCHWLSEGNCPQALAIPRLPQCGTLAWQSVHTGKSAWSKRAESEQTLCLLQEHEA